MTKDLTQAIRAIQKEKLEWLRRGNAASSAEVRRILPVGTKISVHYGSSVRTFEVLGHDGNSPFWLRVCTIKRRKAQRLDISWRRITVDVPDGQEGQ